MMRVRLKADGRLVEILADGSERHCLPPPEADRRILAPSIQPGDRRKPTPATPAASARRPG